LEVRVSDSLAFAVAAVEAAMAAGATDAEATASISDRFSAEARDTLITKLEQSRSRSLSVRVFVGTRRAQLGTSDLTTAGIRDLCARAVEAARFVTEDEFSGLPASFATDLDAGPLEIASDDVTARTADAKVADILDLERRIRAGDARIDNSNGSRIGDGSGETGLANSRGFRGTYRSTSASLGTSPVARDGEHKRISYYGTGGRSYASLDSPQYVAREAVRRAIAMCGATTPQTQTMPIVFERDVAASVLGDLFDAFSASNVAVGNSYLVGKIGEKIGSDFVTIVDDGRLIGGLGTSPFDAEGVATRMTTVFEAGVLKTYLYDTYYGRKLGAASTGNAGGGGAIGANNLYLRAGSGSLEDLIAATRRGILVLDTIGFATENASGGYSRGARGLMIENGALAGPVDGFTIAGNFLEMLGAIDRVADDLRFDSAVVSPSFRVAEMTVSGLG